MNIIDLSHPIMEDMPVYPGTETPQIREACTLDKDGFREKLLTMFSHTGTHMDAPCHILKEAPALDDLPIDNFTGKAFVLNADLGTGGVVEEKVILEASEAISQAEFLLVHTGWSRYWGREEYYGKFPVLSEAAARALAALGLKGIGFDCISADSMDAPKLPNHRIFLGAGMVIIENLCRLEELPQEGAEFFAFPLKIKEADGSPVRAVGRY
ncbi:MAG: cyclase family protein [Spirochaetales bacterium]|nr:cyclase family protein [Spirochaetales bacterium]